MMNPVILRQRIDSFIEGIKLNDVSYWYNVPY